MIKKSLLTSFRFEFNYSGGENIRLSLLAETGLAEVLAEETDVYFKCFFSEKGFEKSAVDLPVNELFIPFPLNSIHYGLYSPLEMVNTGEDNYELYKFLSEIIIEALGEDPFNDEDILTLLIYLHLSYCRLIISKNVEQVYEVCKKYYPTYFETKEANKGHESIIKEFESNKEFLLEIQRDIMTREHSFQWLNKWEAICDDVVERALQNIPHLINRQLGIGANSNMKRRLDYFVAELLHSETIFANS